MTQLPYFACLVSAMYVELGAFKKPVENPNRILAMNTSGTESE